MEIYLFLLHNVKCLKYYKYKIDHAYEKHMFKTFRQFAGNWQNNTILRCYLLVIIEQHAKM